MTRKDNDYWYRPAEGYTGFKSYYDSEGRRFRREAGIKQRVESAIRVAMSDDNLIHGMRVSSGMKAHKVGTQKLEEFQFDPLEELINQLAEISELIELERLRPAPKLSELAKLHGLRSAIYQAILPYKYGKAPTITVLDSDREAPLRIILTSEDESETSTS
jgi:hypothetical protein